MAAGGDDGSSDEAGVIGEGTGDGSADGVVVGPAFLNMKPRPLTMRAMAMATGIP
jgi:hypothetical protein